jgi:crossover junction endodeoxyribonuclease RusA
MTEEIKFFIDCIPPKTTHQAAMRYVPIKGKGIRAFKSKKGQQAEADLISLLAPFRPETAFEGPLRLSMVWVWPWRKGDSKKVRELGAIPYASRPDLSNLVKMAEDTLTRLSFWHDDSQVCDLQLSKALGDRPGLGIEIAKIDA